MTVATSRGYLKAGAAGTDILEEYLTADLPPTLDLIDADMTAALAGRNLLTNPGFEVHQRGGTVTADLAYAHDRWQLDLGGTSTAAVQDDATIVSTGSGHAMKVTYVHGSAVSRIEQKLEGYLQLRGRTLTFALDALQPVSSSGRPYIDDSGTRTYGPVAAGAGVYARRSVTAAIGAAATAVRVGWEFAATDTVYLDNATFCVGSVAVPYVPLHPQEDLARCQRFYQEFGGLLTTEMIAVLQASTTVDAFGAVTFPVEMVTTPTATVSAAADWTVFSANGTGLACTGVTLTPTRRGSRIAVVVASGLVAGNASGMRASATTNARLRFEANP